MSLGLGFVLGLNCMEVLCASVVKRTCGHGLIILLLYTPEPIGRNKILNGEGPTDWGGI